MSIRLTKRDLEILIALARVGFLKINQIQNKWFASYWSCIKRLAKLREYKYIDCIYIERNGSGIYFLTKHGLDFTNDYYGEENKSYGKSSKITHYISCGEFYLNFPYEILHFKIEYYLNEFIPDIYICYEGKRQTDLLVEIDNTKRLNKFLPKIKNYENYLKSNKWKENFKKFPKCLVVSNIIGLEEQIKKRTVIPFTVMNFEDLKNSKLENVIN